MTDKLDPGTAVENLLELVGGGHLSNDRLMVMAVQWPSLAAALAALLEAYDMKPPRPLRAAAAAVSGDGVSADWCWCSMGQGRHLHDGTLPDSPVFYPSGR